MTRPALTIVSQWYPPEQAPFGRMMHELASHLAARGWDVTVITGFPNHPGGEVFAGYRKRWLHEERLDGVRVRRVWLATSPDRSMFNRLATFVSFTITSALRLLRGGPTDLVFAVLQPLSVGALLPSLARLRGARLVLNLQDLHPDTQIRLGMVRNPWLIRALRAVERHAYRRSAGLTAICESFREHAVARGACASTACVIPNWIDTARIYPSAEQGAAFRARCGIGPERFVVLWAGTLGHVSGAMHVVEAAALLRDAEFIQFLVVGEGPLRQPMLDRARQLGLTNLRFEPFQPEESLVAVQNAGDLSLVTLEEQFAESSVPSKVLAYLAAGRPVLAAVPRDCETARLLQRARAGIIVPPGDAPGLAAAIRSLAADREQARRLGQAARDHAVRELSRDAALAAYERCFLTLAGNP